MSSKKTKEAKGKDKSKEIIKKIEEISESVNKAKEAIENVKEADKLSFFAKIWQWFVGILSKIKQFFVR